jgi:REP element-mobilizing transposase RayT
MKDFEYYNSNNLPHINIKGYFMFITFRTYDSIDSYVKKINNQDIKSNKKQYLIDQYLDNSQNGAYLNGNNIDILKNIIFEKNNQDYIISSFAIMPNHVHISIGCFEDIKTIIKNIKGKSSYQINKHINKKGIFWLKDYYNKIIKDQNSFDNITKYILNNPIKANLSDSQNRVYFDIHAQDKYYDKIDI